MRLEGSPWPLRWHLCNAGLLLQRAVSSTNGLRGGPRNEHGRHPGSCRAVWLKAGGLAPSRAGEGSPGEATRGWRPQGLARRPRGYMVGPPAEPQPPEHTRKNWQQVELKFHQQRAVKCFLCLLSFCSCSSLTGTLTPPANVLPSVCKGDLSNQNSPETGQRRAGGPGGASLAGHASLGPCWCSEQPEYSQCQRRPGRLQLQGWPETSHTSMTLKLIRDQGLLGVRGGVCVFTRHQVSGEHTELWEVSGQQLSCVKPTPGTLLRASHLRPGCLRHPH